MKFIAIFIFALILGLGSSYLYFSHLAKTVTKIPLPLPPTPTLFQFFLDTPPASSLIGEISSPSGDIFWQSRTATEESKLETSVIKQGESISTGANSRVLVTFSDIATLKILPDSRLLFAQTLPENLVISQSAGRVFYQRLGSVPLSVRSLHLLVNINSDNLVISVDPRLHLVYLDLYTGTATLAFNNSQMVTQNLSYSYGKRIVYNDTTRTLTLKKLPPKD